ncbi:hypothetical protein K470DRAFT_281540 [Piedraia hortae CBS 480.64]|uniref:Serine hydrolase domain-containing protein n=1 Tax=Piedraia hortae CBS 480.64 TaxID=1314780 RepID=A0A6A7C2E8_9PEZI|nr:hypothetical protein K470DRAFT_281540 [Piedraia hortae CBS 480.64]
MPPKLKILMLHGYTQSGRTFDLKTKALQKSLEKAFPPAPKLGFLKSYPAGVEFVYPTAPLRLDPTDIPGYKGEQENTSSDAYGWWRRKGDSEPYIYDGMEDGLTAIAEVLITQGPFDVVLGFSQGGAAAGLVASLLESGRQEAFEKAKGMPFPKAFRDLAHSRLKAAVSYSGFGAGNDVYRGFYEPKIGTPMLHFIGSMDTVVSEERSLKLVDACEERRVVYHPGGHFLPAAQKQCLAALVGFLREVCDGGGDAKEDDEDDDGELPF